MAYGIYDPKYDLCPMRNPARRLPQRRQARPSRVRTSDLNLATFTADPDDHVRSLGQGVSLILSEDGEPVAFALSTETPVGRALLAEDQKEQPPAEDEDQ